MKFINCKPGSDEWLQSRVGVITASMFSTAVEVVNGLSAQQKKYVDAILNGDSEDVAANAGGYKTKVKRTETVQRAIDGLPVGEPSMGSNLYLGATAIERISGLAQGEPPKAWVLARGHEMEERARVAYEDRFGFMVMESGLVTTDDSLFGYSTDGFVDDDGFVEIKSPVDANKINAMLLTGDVSEYIHQIQGGLWITGRKWCDFIMYVPGLELAGCDLYVKRIFRDEEFIDAMVKDLLDFNKRAVRLIDFYRAQGIKAAAYQAANTNNFLKAA